jgi:hypothetical protein
MANGDTLLQWRPQQAVPIQKSGAELIDRNGYKALAFDDSATEYAIFDGVIDARKAGANYKLEIVWAADNVATGNVMWQVEFARGTANGSGFDLDENNFAAAVGFSAAAAPGAAGRIVYTNSGNISNANADGIAADEFLRIRIARLGGNASDTMVGDAHVIAVILRDAT